MSGEGGGREAIVFLFGWCFCIIFGASLYNSVVGFLMGAYCADMFQLCYGEISFCLFLGIGRLRWLGLSTLISSNVSKSSNDKLIY